MKSRKTDFTLDNTAQELYQQLAGIDMSSRVVDQAPSASALIELLGEEEKWLDHYRLLMTDAAALLAEILHHSRLPTLAAENEQKTETLLALFKKIAEFHKVEGKFLCRYQGRLLPTEKPGTEAFDYEVSAGTLVIDMQVARVMAKRGGPVASAIPAKLTKTSKTLSALEINCLELNIGTGEKKELDSLRNAIRHLCRFLQELAASDPGDFIVTDEYGLPNPNLTLLAAHNGLKAVALQNLVEKIKPMMFGPAAQKELDGFTTVYDALFAFKKLRAQLAKPPLEMNNVQRFMGSGREKSPPRDQARISRAVLANYGNSPQVAAEVLTSVNDQGYKNIYCGTLQKRLSLATDFLAITADSTARETLQQTALANIEQGLEMVGDDIYESINIEKNEVNTVDENGRVIPWNIHGDLLGILSFFKRRTIIKKKIREMSQRQIEFDAQDYAVIAKNFSITEEEARHLVGLLKECFDTSGRFRRPAFEKNIPEFIRYEAKVFEFLWHYLKELIVRDDRVAFLNALQHLISRLHEPQKALHVLLADIFRHAYTVGYSDRNGLILANILLRRYNQELGSHIELTPEEVLQVREGLEPPMLTAADDFLEEEREHLFQKFRTIHEKLQQAADPREEQGKDAMPVRYLITLERELIIFLSLVGGKTAHLLVQGVTREYGNPTSAIYRSQTTTENFRAFLQLLQVAARGLRRFSDVEDLAVFQAIYNREHDFLALWDHKPHAKLVRRVLEWMR